MKKLFCVFLLLFITGCEGFDTELPNEMDDGEYSFASYELENGDEIVLSVENDQTLIIGDSGIMILKLYLQGDKKSDIALDMTHYTLNIITTEGELIEYNSWLAQSWDEYPYKNYPETVKERLDFIAKSVNKYRLVKSDYVLLGYPIEIVPEHFVEGNGKVTIGVDIFHVDGRGNLRVEVPVNFVYDTEIG